MCSCAARARSAMSNSIFERIATSKPRRLACVWLAALVLWSSETPPARALAGSETIGEALCRTIESAAHTNHLPVGFFTRLIWQESSFRPHVVSPAGAQGIAQFMPQTARERGLADPFDPEQAIPEAARLLADHRLQFGNLGLAAAAYNAGPTRLANWLAGHGPMPAETRDYVFLITSRSVDDWAKDRATTQEPAESNEAKTCLQMTATLRLTKQVPLETAALAPWGVQLAGNFSKERALASYYRESRKVANVIGDLRPMIIGTRWRSRGTRIFYRVRVPSETRSIAIDLCNKIHANLGACIVLRT
jgi:hypothetical protein